MTTQRNDPRGQPGVAKKESGKNSPKAKASPSTSASGAQASSPSRPDASTTARTAAATSANPVGSASANAASTWGLRAIAVITYDPNEFYVIATDIKGHGKKVTFSIPPDVHARLVNLVFMDEFPKYTCLPDIARDFMVHGLHLREDQVGDPALRQAMQDTVIQCAYAERVATRDRQIESWRAILADLRGLLRKQEQDQAWMQMVDTLVEAEQRAGTIAEPYATRLIALVQEWKPKVPSNVEAPWN